MANYLKHLCVATTTLFLTGAVISCDRPNPPKPPVQQTEPLKPETPTPETTPEKPQIVEPEQASVTETTPIPKPETLMPEPISEQPQVEAPTEQPPITEPEPTPEQSANPINHPLISTPDAGTTLDENLAGKVRRVAQFVINNMDKSEIITNGVKIYDNNFKIDNKFYTICVYNFDETKPDMITIWEYDPKISIRDEIISFVDESLDGKVNEGHNAYREKFHSDASEKKHFVKASQEGLEFEIEFQNKYEEVLDKLLKFYENNNKKE